MKIKNIFTYFAILVSGTGLVKAQLTGTENYVYSKTYLSKPGDSAYMQTPPLETVTYFDGLGRPKQNILVNGAGNGKDLVTAIKYDEFGRQVLDILPVPANTLSKGFHDTILDESTANAYYSGKGLGGNAYSEKKLELSPLDRIEHQYGPGDAWKSNSKKSEFFYETNGNEVKNYIATYNYTTSTSSISLSSSPYAPNTLYKNRATDEDGNYTMEYKNGKGQTILVRKIAGSTDSQGIAPIDNNIYADTYYVYNNYNQLAYVIPPLGVNAGNVSPNTLDNLCYQYIYDGKGRLVEKKLPGKGREFLVYDRADRLILTQDGNLATTGKWLITKYDQFGRVIYTGLIPGGTRESMQSQAGNLIIIESSDTTGFTKNGITIYYTYGYFGAPETVLSVNYYDKYPTGTPFPTQNKIFGEAILQDAYDTESKSVKSLPTASFVKNINDDRWTKNYTFYDKRGRPVGSHSTNHLGGSTMVHSRIDFTGTVYKTKTYNKRINAEFPVVVEEKFEYDDQKKLLKHYHQVLGKTPPELLAENTYNELGQLTEKKVGNNLQTIDYNYNIRGWMTGINLVNGALSTNKLFSYKINYENPANPLLKKYNGNISEIDWWTSPSATSNRYDYSYDGLNRLKKADFKTVGATGTTDSRLFNEELTYDANGNITTLKRNGKTSASATIGTLVDNLNYIYTGNRVTNISDDTSNPTGYKGAGQLITYDVNGNMKTFPDKGISQINYNFLNLPQNIIQNSNSTNYIYRADGTKVNKSFLLNGTTINTDYLNGFVYTSTYTQQLEAALLEDDLPTKEAVSAGQEESMQLEQKLVVDHPQSLATAKPSFFPTAEGFFDYDNLKYIYQYKDHLGNVRLSYSKNATTGLIAIEDTNDYYPFGLSFVNTTGSKYSPSTTYKNYKYQEQELQETGFYSFKWRQYMPDVGRFFNVDPLSEKYAYQSHYNFSENKVVSHRELEGLEAIPAGNFNKNQTSLVVLGLGRANGRAGDGVGSGTNTLYSNLPKNLQTDGALSSLQNSLGSNIAVAAYTGTDSGLASTHMVETIANYRSVNPDGSVIMIGHSAGGKDILNAANSTSESINLVLTMEPVSVDAGGGTAYSSNPYTVTMGENVQNIISLSAENNMFTGGGGVRSNNSQQSVKATMPGTSHVNIDDSMTPYLKPLIQRTDQGVNPVNWFQKANFNNFQVQPNVRTGNEEKKGTGSGS